MKRSHLMYAPALLAAFAVGLPGLPALAQDSTKLREIGEMEVKSILEAAAAETDPDRKAALYRQAFERQQAVEGAVGGINRVTSEMDRSAAQAERDRKMYDKPGFWDKIGDKAIDIAGSLISQLLQQWIDGGGKDDALLNQINELQAERDRLMNERETPGPGAGDPGLGRIITDPNGNYGYDRDGDGFVDIPINPDGTLGPYKPTDGSGYDAGSGFDSGGTLPSFGGADGGLGDLASSIITDRNGVRGIDLNGDGLVDVPLDGSSPSDLPPGMAGMGGAGMGGGFGGGFTNGAGGEGMNPEGGVAGLGADGAAGLGGEAGADGGLAGGPGGLSAGGAGGATGGSSSALDERKLETVIGRVIVSPKPPSDDNLVGDRKAAESNPWADEWANDGWDDSRDNGDWGDAEDAKASAELVDALIRVEMTIADWRKEEAKKKGGGADPYGFQDDKSGFRAAGAERDPFKDVRDRDGKIDLSKVDVWVVERDTWKEGEEPVRYKVTLSPELRDLDPIHGGVLVARGILGDLDVDRRVLDEIRGKVKTLEVVQVVLSAEKPPEDMDMSTYEPRSGTSGGSWGSDSSEPSTSKDKKKSDDWDDWGDDWGSDW